MIIIKIFINLFIIFILYILIQHFLNSLHIYNISDNLESDGSGDNLLYYKLLFLKLGLLCCLLKGSKMFYNEYIYNKN